MDSDREFDHLDTALNIAFGVSDGFAMFVGKELGEWLHITDDEIGEFH
jgi:hypothetical protein